MGAAACTAPPGTVSSERISIPRGASLATVAETLAARKVVPSAELLQFYAKITGRERGIQAGTYELSTGASIRDVLEMLVTGRAAMEQFTIPEGLTLREVALAIERQLGIPADTVLAAAADSSLRTKTETDAPTLEGFLYPSTYYVPLDADAPSVVRQMVAEFEAQWQPEWTKRLDSLGMSRFEIVTLASIIEGEVRHPADRGFVSSVYHNRLRRSMRLQADPTVIYALGRRRRLFEKDYQTPSPYNTYLIDGLPPGPIGQPSNASIEAALYPTPSDFLYFVARPDGQHVFSRTLREHLNTIRQVRRSGSGSR